MDSTSDIKRATMTVEEMAVYLGIGRNKAYRMARERGVPALRLGRRIVIPREEFEAWILRETKGQPIRL